MKRGLPFFSPAAVGLTLVVFLVLGVAIWTGGGLGFSPGPVSGKSLQGIKLNGYSSHVDFETNCSLCHQPLQTRQNLLCLDCHKDINQQMTSKTGTHGKYSSSQHCAECHLEHKGRGFDPSGLALAAFDHNHTPFTLTGQHTQVQCIDCHKQTDFSKVAKTCVECHAEPAAHKSLFDNQCEACHTTSAWKPVTMDGKQFDHSSLKFTLAHHDKNYSGEIITCASCHSNNTQASQTSGTGSLTSLTTHTTISNSLVNFTFNQSDIHFCTDCHTSQDASFMGKHVAQYGSACLDCHDGADRMANFDHNKFFPLDGKHQSIECATCHKNQQYATTPTQCVACHAEPKSHAGNFGLSCQYCHTTAAWNPALLHKHTFPLDHGSPTQLACQTCHPSTDAVYTCYSCHDHVADEIQTSHLKVGISLTDLPNCASCHATGKVEKK
jgi:hypothetical protein